MLWRQSKKKSGQLGAQVRGADELAEHNGVTVQLEGLGCMGCG